MIKHDTYPKGPTLEGNTACIKRHSERISVKLLTNMGRLTNPSYNFLARSDIPIKSLNVRKFYEFLSSSKFNKPTTSSGFRKGSPKLALRRKRMELVITRNLKKSGLRRVHSTVRHLAERNLVMLGLIKIRFRVYTSQTIGFSKFL